MPQLHVRTKTRAQEYDITIDSGVLTRAGGIARDCLNSLTRRICIISNQRVFNLYGNALTKSLRSNNFNIDTWLMGDGERNKTLAQAEKALGFLNESRFERTDAIVTLGGGVVGDLGGFVAATYLRGIQFIQVPTTLLAQVDASVGGKTGVNLGSAKNAIGAFYQPRAVITDVDTLKTLPARELVAGWCETIKHGAVGSKQLFKQTTDYLLSTNSRTVAEVIVNHCAFKASIIAADEREDPQRQDSRSRRILNFGHTVGHALESVTGYRRFRHGEAVGYGMLAAGEISKNLGLLKDSELKLLTEGVRLCGPLPPAHDLDETSIIEALTQDKKSTAGHIQWVLLEKIGQPKIVDGKHVSKKLLRQSIRTCLQTRN